MEEKPVIKNCITFGFTVASWYHDGEGKLCHTSSAPKTRAEAISLCEKIAKGKVRTYSGFLIEGYEFEGKKVFAVGKQKKSEVTDF